MSDEPHRCRAFQRKLADGETLNEAWVHDFMTSAPADSDAAQSAMIDLIGHRDLGASLLDAIRPTICPLNGRSTLSP